MTPCELNAAIAAITNYFYCTLSRREFNTLAVVLSLISKQMFTLVAMRDICARDGRWDNSVEEAAVAEALD